MLLTIDMYIDLCLKFYICYSFKIFRNSFFGDIILIAEVFGNIQLWNKKKISLTRHLCDIYNLYCIWEFLAGSHWAIIMDMISNTSNIFIHIFYLFLLRMCPVPSLCKHQMKSYFYLVLFSFVLMEHVYMR